MSTAWLGIGSNVNAPENVRSGLAALTNKFEAARMSPVYRSESVGFDGEDFLNLVVSVRTDLQPLDLKDWLNQLEDRHGRLRDVPKFSDRTLDIDILLFDDCVMNEDGLELPRAEILRFAHVLRPLADLSPDLRHPVDGRTFADIWAAFDKADTRLEPITLDLQ